ncbi:MAG: CHASE4 domain-containing protein [Pirellulaceae bacterium]
MTIRRQLATLLVALSLAIVFATYAIQTWIVMPAFVEIERQGATRNMDRCLDALHRDVEHLSNLVKDWSAWDDTCRYLADRNENYHKSNLNKEAFDHAHVNLICLLDTDHRIVWCDTRDMETLESIEVPDLIERLQVPDPRINLHTELESERRGFLLTSQGPMMLASRPVITSQNEGPIRGTVLMGRFLTNDEVERLSARTHIPLEIWTLPRGWLPPDLRRAAQELGDHQRPVVHSEGHGTLYAYATVDDFFGSPLLLIRARLPRDVTRVGGVAMRVATGCSLAGGLLLVTVLGMALQHRIVHPLQQLAQHAVRVGRTDDLKARLNFRRQDEMGILAREFDGMVQSLAESRKRVLVTAHRAGQAEIASEVLHNVGNAVNSANCSVELLEEQLHRSKLPGLKRAVQLLIDERAQLTRFFQEDPRGEKWIDYVVSLHDNLQREKSDAAAEISRLRDTVRHIRDAIAVQQTYAGKSDFRQDVDVAAVLDEALQLNQEELRIRQVQVTVDVPSLPEVQLNKSKISQVLVNLLRNAIQAMETTPAAERRLHVRVGVFDERGLEWEIQDNGCGFDAQLRGRLFSHGFTTKPSGNGFGLHFCANAIQEMGGSISAESPGPGRGATIRIQLPDVLPAAARV